MNKLLFALPLLAAAPLIAQGGPPAKPGAKDPTRVTAGTYKADPGHSLVGWRVDHLGFNDYFGLFGDVSGTLALDPAKPSEAKVDVTIPVASVTTASAGLTKHLLKPAAEGGKADFFGAAPAPARFVSTSVVVNGTEAKITGNLTLNGVTKPVTLDADFVGAGKTPPFMGGKETVGFEAEATIKRSDFGIAYGIPMVSDEVELQITVAFEK